MQRPISDIFGGSEKLVQHYAQLFQKVETLGFRIADGICPIRYKKHNATIAYEF